VVNRSSRCETRHSWARGFSFAPPTTILTWRRESRRWFRGRSSSDAGSSLRAACWTASTGGTLAPVELSCLDPAKDASAPGQQGRPKDVDLFVYGLTPLGVKQVCCEIEVHANKIAAVRHRISHVCHVAKRDWHQARATLPDGTINPHLLFLPDSRYFDPGVAVPSPFDGVGQYMKPSKRSTPRYIELEQQAQTAETKGAVEQREREREHSRLMEYRKRLGVDGPARHPEHLKQYEARPRPRFVPYVVRSNPYRDEQVKWRPPVEEPVEPEYISTADAVEVPPPPMLRAASESADRQRRVVAYDDGDPFPFPVRILPPPPHDVGAPPLEFFGPAGLTVVHTAAKVILFTPDRSRVYQVMCGVHASPRAMNTRGSSGTSRVG
jgi:hypothetical protein